MSSGCHCFAVRLLTRDHDSQPVMMDAARGMSIAIALGVSPPPNWISRWATNAIATVAKPKVAGQSLGLRKKNPDTTAARARIAKMMKIAGVARLNEATKASHIPDMMNRMLVRLRTLYREGEITAADKGGVKENGFPSAWLALVVPRCFFPVITSTGALTKFSTRMILCWPMPEAGPASME